MLVDELVGLLKQSKMVDLSQTYEERMPGSPNHSRFFHNLWGSYTLGDRSLNYQLSMNEHSGTHVDAPAHFIPQTNPEGHISIDAISLDHLVGRGVRLECHGLKEGDYVDEQFIRDWERKHGAILENDIVLFDFGWARYWGLRPDHQAYLHDWPGVGKDAAEYLVSKRIAALGVDTLSPDPAEAHRQKRAIHPVALRHRVLIIENLTNLNDLPDFFVFLAFPLKIRDGSGSPIRAVALI